MTTNRLTFGGTGGGTDNYTTDSRRAGDPDEPHINYLVLAKGRERYTFTFRDDQRVDVCRAFGRLESNPDLSFTWYDADVLSGKVREMLEVRT